MRGGARTTGPATRIGRVETWRQDFGDLRDETRRAFADFLALPTSIIAGFLLLAAGTYVLDRTKVGWLTPLRAALRSVMFTDSRSTADLLNVVATGLITTTSITFSLVLLAVQQAAGSMTFQVIDQFLRRRLNQVAFGFFVGLALYALVVLATVTDADNPVYGASLAFLLTAVALYLLLLLLYTTINQMRPAEIIDAIHDHTLAARDRQRRILVATRRAALLTGPRYTPTPVRVSNDGFIVNLDTAALDRALRGQEEQGSEVEITLLVTIGAYVAFEDTVAEIRADRAEDAARLVEPVRRAIWLGRQRDLRVDPAYGIEQIATIAWTSVSTSKSNPAPGLLAIRNLRDLLLRWVSEPDDARADASAGDARPASPLPVVYTDDTPAQLMDTLESLAVVASESMQHQSYAEVVRVVALTFARLPADLQWRAEDLVRRILTALGDFVLTADLEAALERLIRTLDAADRHDTAGAVRSALATLRLGVGTLRSRATRAPSDS
jgi:uncharacterized membrane protein